MSIPIPFYTLIQNRLKHLPLKDLQALSRDISKAYHGGTHLQTPAISSEDQAYVYAAVRLPATYAVTHAVLDQLPQELSVGSILDMGTGPGTLLWAACMRFQDLHEITGIENNPHMLNLAKVLASLFPTPCTLIQKNILDLKDSAPHDLVTLSYVVSELPEKALFQTLDFALNSATKGLILIDTGTPKGFEVIRKARTYLIERGAYCYAPCGHEAPCPMTGKDWCHFSARLNRNPLHQQIKGGTLNWEDEKYSYLIVLKKYLPPAGPRILKKPLKHKGHIVLDLCSESGITRQIISKKETSYKDAKKDDWGGIF